MSGEPFVRVAEYHLSVRYWPESGFFTAWTNVKTAHMGDGYYRKVPATRNYNEVYEDLSEDIAHFLVTLQDGMMNQLPLF